MRVEIIGDLFEFLSKFQMGYPIPLVVVREQSCIQQEVSRGHEFFGACMCLEFQIIT